MRKLPVLPPMQCDDNCGACGCISAVTVPESEYQATVAHARAHGVTPVQGSACPWYQGGRCAVYEARPWICRVIGHAPQFACNRGYSAHVADPKPLWEEFARGGAPLRFLQEACLEWDPSYELNEHVAQVLIWARKGMLACEWSRAELASSPASR